MDFGGGSFIGLAQELKRRGHSVNWVFSCSEMFDYSDYAEKILKGADINFTDAKQYYLTIDLHKNSVPESAHALEKHIRNDGYDCLVVDRLCVGAAYASCSAGIPWATVGTDGRAWSNGEKDANGIYSLRPLENKNDYFALENCGRRGNAAVSI